MSVEIRSKEIKEEASSPEPMDDESDEILNEICTNAIKESKAESVEEGELRNSQEEGKRKFDDGNDLHSDIKTENNICEENVAGNGKWCEEEEDYQSVPKKIRESHSNDPGEQEQRPRKNSASSSSTASSGHNHRRQVEYEMEPSVLARRQKDIDYGKNTIGYDRYIQQIPKDKRIKDHPRTPPMHLKYTRRGWDGMVKLWRKQLHFWDPPKEISDGDKTKEDTSEENSATCQ